MHKIRCPRCDMVNLEKFVTYPQCAGCGVTLPQPEMAAAPFWRRPLNRWTWILAVGATLAGILVAASLLQPPPEDQDSAVIYGSASKSGEVGGLILVTMTLDAITAQRSLRSAPLRGVKLRLPLDLFDEMLFVSISPPPDSMTISGRSRYFNYDSLPRESTVTLRLRAVKPGRKRFRISFYATGLLPGDWQVKTTISKTKKPIA